MSDLKEIKCTCKEHDPYCCKIHGLCKHCCGDKRKIEIISERIQRECHLFVESVPNVSYQEATNVFIFMKLAELTLNKEL